MFGKIIPIKPPTTASRVKLLNDRIKFLQSQLVRLNNMRAQGALSADEVAIRSVPINGEIYQLTQLIRGSRIQSASYDESSMWWTQRRGETNQSARGGYNYSAYTAPSQTSAAKPAKKYVSESYHVPTVAPASMSVPDVSTPAMQTQSTRSTAARAAYDHGDINQQAQNMPVAPAPTYSTASEVSTPVNPFVDEDTRFMDDIYAQLTFDQFFNMVDDILRIDGTLYGTINKTAKTVAITPTHINRLKSPRAVSARPKPHVNTIIENINNALLAKARMTDGMITILNDMLRALQQVQSEIAAAQTAAASAAAAKAEAEAKAREQAAAAATAAAQAAAAKAAAEANAKAEEEKRKAEQKAKEEAARAAAKAAEAAMKQALDNPFSRGAATANVRGIGGWY